MGDSKDMSVEEILALLKIGCRSKIKRTYPELRHLMPDIYQKIAMAYLMNRPTFVGKGQAVNWAKVATENEIKQMGRKQKSHENFLESLCQADVMAETREDPTEQVIEEDWQEAFREKELQLPPNVDLRKWISAQLGILGKPDFYDLLTGPVRDLAQQLNRPVSYITALRDRLRRRIRANDKLSKAVWLFLTTLCLAVLLFSGWTIRHQTAVHQERGTHAADALSQKAAPVDTFAGHRSPKRTGSDFDQIAGHRSPKAVPSGIDDIA